jgi:hypothetical protein
MRSMLAGLGVLLALCGCGAPGTGDPGVPSATGAAPVDAGAGSGTGECTHPAGFRVSHPADWSVNEGVVLPVCSWFAARSFTVPEASGVRTADIAFSVRPGDEVPERWADETARRPVDVDGRAAVRLEQETTAGLYPAGTPITTYVLDLPSDGEVLVANTIGLPGTDYARNVSVLDEMMTSLVLVAASDV